MITVLYSYSAKTEELFMLLAEAMFIVYRECLGGY
jgi:hypothetical protein